MKIHSLILCGIILIFCNLIYAETAPVVSSDRELMQQILKERKEKFSTYTESLDDATGIFGMKTRKDLKRSQKVLVEIVRLDNRLINVLNRKIDYNKFENISKTYDQKSENEMIALLKQNIALSEKKIISLEEQNKSLQNHMVFKNILLFFMGVGIGYFVYQQRKKKAILRKN